MQAEELGRQLDIERLHLQESTSSSSSGLSELDALIAQHLAQLSDVWPLSPCICWELWCRGGPLATVASIIRAPLATGESLQ